MTLVVDAGALYVQARLDDPDYETVARCLQAETGSIVTTELALAEADYLILTRLGIDVEIEFIADVVQGTFAVECLSRPEMHLAWRLIEQYRDLELGLADASLAVLAYRFRTHRILSFDERAFRTVRPIQGGTFQILPADL